MKLLASFQKFVGGLVDAGNARRNPAANNPPKGTSTMSKFSDIIHDVGAFFAGLAAQAPSAAAPQLVQVQTSLQNAASAAEAALPAAAEVAVNALLAAIPGGPAYDALADAFVSEVVAQLIARHPAAAPTMQPVAN